MDIVITPLNYELNSDYLDFFNNRAFLDRNPNSPCYCTSPNQSQAEIRKMVDEFSQTGVKADNSQICCTNAECG